MTLAQIRYALQPHMPRISSQSFAEIQRAMFNHLASGLLGRAEFNELTETLDVKRA